MTLIIDTGGLLSVLDDRQDDHEAFLKAVETAPGPLAVSPLVLAELDHLVLKRYGRAAELAVIEEVEAAYSVEEITVEHLARSRALLSRYADLTTFDLTDASCVVLAEKHDCFDVLTTDQRRLPGHRWLRRQTLPHPPLRSLTLRRYRILVRASRPRSTEYTSRRFTDRPKTFRVRRAVCLPPTKPRLRRA